MYISIWSWRYVLGAIYSIIVKGLYIWNVYKQFHAHKILFLGDMICVVANKMGRKNFEILSEI